ncbi:MAG TPA: hypothetical protein VIK01_26670 [Polyangiaceae bacterium]
MSALIFQGDRQLTEVTVLAVDAQAALEHASNSPTAWEPTVSRLTEQLMRIAGLDWWFEIHDTPEAIEAARRQLLAHRDYVRSALFVAAGSAGDRVEWLLERTGSGLLSALRSQREAAAARLHDLDLALRFLLEEDDPTGEVERAFSVPMPPPQPDAPSAEFDFN